MRKLSKEVFTFIKLKKKGFKVQKELINKTVNQKKIRTVIFSALKKGPRTIPEIAAETGLEPYLVTWYLMTYVKYRLVKPCEKTDEDYWKYELAVSGG